MKWGSEKLLARQGVASAWLLIALGLAGTGALRAKAQEQATTLPPAVFFLHGRIYTNDAKQPWAAAMAVREGKIVCIGSIEHVLLECGGGADGAETVQLGGRFVMPGFNDAHVHIGRAGADFLSVRLNGTSSIEDLQKRLADAVATHKEGEWITGDGWDHTIWPEKAFPTRQQLDAIAPKNPVFLMHVSKHVAVANSLALQISGIDKARPNPAGGQIEHDANGEPTGMLEEDSAMRMVEQNIPEASAEERRRGIEMALEDAAKNGVTSLQDNSEWEDFLVYRQLKDEGRLTARITEWLPFTATVHDLENMRSGAA